MGLGGAGGSGAGGSVSAAGASLVPQLSCAAVAGEMGLGEDVSGAGECGAGGSAAAVVKVGLGEGCSGAGGFAAAAGKVELGGAGNVHAAICCRCCWRNSLAIFKYSLRCCAVA